jgi:hypothetical protein
VSSWGVVAGKEKKERGRVVDLILKDEVECVRGMG